VYASVLTDSGQPTTLRTSSRLTAPHVRMIAQSGVSSWCDWGRCGAVQDSSLLVVLVGLREGVVLFVSQPLAGMPVSPVIVEAGAPTRQSWREVCVAASHAPPLPPAAILFSAPCFKFAVFFCSHWLHLPALQCCPHWQAPRPGCQCLVRASGCLWLPVDFVSVRHVCPTPCGRRLPLWPCVGRHRLQPHHRKVVYPAMANFKLKWFSHSGTTQARVDLWVVQVLASPSRLNL
jgi:hypothetical protein